MKILQTYS